MKRPFGSSVQSHVIPSNPAESALFNEHLVLDALREGVNTRNDIMSEKGMMRTTAWDALIRLEKKGLVKRESPNRAVKGRPNTIWIIVE